MTHSFEDCDWLVVQEGKKRAVLGRAYSHRQTHTNIIYIMYI